MVRRVRLLRLDPEPEDDSRESRHFRKGDDVFMEPEKAYERPSGVLGVITHTLEPLTPELSEVGTAPGEEGAHDLLKRTPLNYLINQGYGLWLYISLFLLTILLARGVSVGEYAIYVEASAAFNTIAYIVAF